MKRTLSLSLLVLSGVLVGLLMRGFPVRQAVGGIPLNASQNGDVNGDGFFDIADPLFMLFYMFGEGPEPVACAVGIPTDLTTLNANVERIANAVEAMVPTDLTALQESLDRIADSTEETIARQGASSVCDDPARYVDNGDGTFTDTCTGLMWTQEPVHDSTEPRAIADAAIEELTLAGYDDWRMPTLYDFFNLDIRPHYHASRPHALPTWVMDITKDIHTATDVAWEDGYHWVYDTGHGPLRSRKPSGINSTQYIAFAVRDITE